MSEYGDRLVELAYESARRHGVPPRLVLGVIGAESSFDPSMNRPTWEQTAGEHSWGHMQVLGSTARDRGWRSDFDGLLDPPSGIDIGTAHLRWLIERFGLDEADIWSAYNRGRPDRTAGAQYIARARAWADQMQTNAVDPVGLIVMGAILMAASVHVKRR